ncbi:MAG: hypothetical protein IPP15_16990 [Saprospiraceae bacterium]|uniref:Uncharacterized protein n=1 Tax=Candidatus Opimibacter skivensis TaxID=2982028 RepID=A0A9D7SY17_9BACT|nr:hypothetical protein [Candidatus Opimibacter skivensis]
MNNRYKIFCSILVIGIFIFFAAASDLLDESTNVSIVLKPEDCEVKPVFTGTLKVQVSYTVKNGNPIPGVLGQIILSNQKIDDTDNCTSFYRTSLSADFVLDNNGKYTYETPPYSHDNKGDLWRVEVWLKSDPILNIPGFRDVKVAFYNTNLLQFNAQLPSPL